MPLKVVLSQVIDRPVADVFRFHAQEHVRNHPRWDPDMHLEQVSEGPIGVGTVIRRLRTHTGTPVEGTMEVVEFAPNRSMEVVIRDGPHETHARATYTSEDAGRTTLTLTVEFLDLDESMESAVTAPIERSLRNIKHLIESET
jgi:hypothetical protein